MADEQAVPGKLCHQPHIQAVRGISPAKKVLNEIIAAFHMGQHVGT